MKIRHFAGIASALVIATAAVSAEVIFDPQTGLGFVGKGDVQLALGLNNAQMQAQAGSLTFTYDAQTTYDVTCEFWTGPSHNRQMHTVTNERSYGVNSAVAYDARRRNQVTGFNLTGMDAGSGDQVPTVGGTCPNGNSGVITDVQLQGSTGGLKVNGVSLQ